MMWTPNSYSPETSISQTTHEPPSASLTSLLDFGKKVGKGVYGDVYQANYRGYPVAVKVIKGSLNDATRRERILEELRIIRTLCHPNVIALMDHYVDASGRLLLITEFCSRGNLKDNLPTLQSLSLRLKLAKDIVSGMHWLHINSIIHRDLKPANILISEDLTAKITDFGLSLRWNPGVVCRSFSGNIKYSPPEILRARENKDESIFHYCPQTDVYAFGLMLWEMITLECPLSEFRGRKKSIRRVIEGYRPVIDETWPKLLKSLLANAWHEEPHRRPLFIEIQAKFDRIVTNLICHGSMGRKLGQELWEGFPTRTIPLREFEQKLIEQTKIKAASYRRGIDYFLNLLVNPFEALVNLDRYGLITRALGPFRDGPSFLEHVEDVLEKEWFHGFISSSQATRLLASELEETRKECYLIRFSASSPGDFNLSYVLFDRTVVHQHITHQKDYYLNDEPGMRYRTLVELHDAVTVKDDLRRMIPCHRTSNLEYLR